MFILRKHNFRVKDRGNGENDWLKKKKKLLVIRKTKPQDLTYNMVTTVDDTKR